MVFGLGLAITVAPLTTTAMGAAPAEHAGVASAVNNDVARIGGLIAVPTLPAPAGITGAAYRHPALLSSGFHTVSLISAGLCIASGALAALIIRNPPAPAPAHGLPPRCPPHCALDAPPPTADQG